MSRLAYHAGEAKLEPPVPGAVPEKQKYAYSSYAELRLHRKVEMTAEGVASAAFAGQNSE